MSDADKEKDIILGFLVVVSALLIIAVVLLIYCWRQRRRRRPDVEAAETGKARETAGCTISASTQPAAPDTVTQGDCSQQTAAVAQNGCSIFTNGSAMDNNSHANNNDIKADDRCALSSSSNINSNDIPGVEADAPKEADGKMDGESSLQQEIATSETGSDAKRSDSGGGGECGGAADTQPGAADHHVYHILEPDIKGKKGRGVLFALDEQSSTRVGQRDEAGFGDRARSDTSTGLLKASDYSECIKIIDRSLTQASSASTSRDSAITVVDNKISDCEVTDAGVYEDVQLKPHPLWPLTLPVAAANNGNRHNVTSPGTVSLSLSSPSSTSGDLCSNPSRQSGYEDIELKPAMQNVNPVSEPGAHEASSAGSAGVNVQRTGPLVRSRSDGQYEQVGDLLDWKALFTLALHHAAEGLRSIAGADSVAASGSAFPIGLPFYSRSQSERTYEQIEVIPNFRLLPARVQPDLPARWPPLAASHAADGPQGISGAYDAIVLHSNLDLPHIEGQSCRAKTDSVTDSNERSANSPPGTQNHPSESEPDTTYPYALPSKLKLKPKYNTAPPQETTQQQAESESRDAICPAGLAEHDRSTVPASIKTVHSGPQTASDSTVEGSVLPDCRVQQRSASEPTAPDIGVGMTVLPSEVLDTAGVYVRLRVVAATAAVGDGGDGIPEAQSGVKDDSK